MKWLENKITHSKLIPIKLTKVIGQELFAWLHRERFNELSNDPNYGDAEQWITNQINKKWSQNELYTPLKKQIKP